MLLFPVGDCCLNRVFSEYGTVNLHRRKAQFLHDIRVLDLQGFRDRLALNPLCGQAGAGDGAAATEGLELRVLDNFGLGIDLDLQLHDVTALRGTDQAGPDVRVLLRKSADVARIVVMIDNLF